MKIHRSPLLTIVHSSHLIAHSRDFLQLVPLYGSLWLTNHTVNLPSFRSTPSIILLPPISIGSKVCWRKFRTLPFFGTFRDFTDFTGFSDFQSGFLWSPNRFIYFSSAIVWESRKIRVCVNGFPEFLDFSNKTHTQAKPTQRMLHLIKTAILSPVRSIYFSRAIVWEIPKIRVCVNRFPDFSDSSKKSHTQENTIQKCYCGTKLPFRAPIDPVPLPGTQFHFSRAIVWEIWKLSLWMNRFPEFPDFSNESQTQERTTRKMLLLFGHPIDSLCFRPPDLPTVSWPLQCSHSPNCLFFLIDDKCHLSHWANSLRTDSETSITPVTLSDVIRFTIPSRGSTLMTLPVGTLSGHSLKNQKFTRYTNVRPWNRASCDLWWLKRLVTSNSTLLTSQVCLTMTLTLCVTQSIYSARSIMLLDAKFRLRRTQSKLWKHSCGWIWR